MYHLKYEEVIRVYLDSSILRYIKEGKEQELEKLIFENRSRFLIPYSPAHLLDLLPSKDHPEFSIDLEFISKLTNNKFISYDKKRGRAMSGEGEPNLVLNEMVKSKNQYPSSIDDVIDLFNTFSDDDEIREHLDKLITALNTPIEYPEDKSTAKTYKDYLQENINKSREITENPQVYKDYRSKLWKLPNNNLDKDVIKKISHQIKEGGQADNFFKLVEKDLSEESRKDQFDYFLKCYMTLNNIGYRADEIKVKKGKGISNHLQDGFHAYIAGHCEYFILTDKRLRGKTAALFNELGIKTKIMSPTEFIREFPTVLSPNDLNQIIGSVAAKTPIDSLEEDGVSKILYRTDEYLFDYFTHVQIEFVKSEKLTIIRFSKKYATYSKFMFFDERKSIIEKFHKHFGFENYNDEVVTKFNSEAEQYNEDYRIGDRTFVRLWADGKEIEIILVLPMEE